MEFEFEEIFGGKKLKIPHLCKLLQIVWKFFLIVPSY